MPQFLKLYGETLVQLGYTVLPIAPGTKRPDIANWPHHATTANDVKRWYSNGRANHGAGINARDTPAIDVDVADPEIAQLMANEIDNIFAGHSLMTRTGHAPKFLIPFRSETPFRKMSSGVYTDGKNTHKVEILGDGQQWVAYAVHPFTHRPYQWFDGLSDSGISEVSRDDLPVLDRLDAQRVIDAFEVLAAGLVADGRWSVKSLERDRDAKPADSEPDPFAAHIPPVTDLSRAQVETLIAKLDFDDRDAWVRAGRILHHQYNGEAEGLEIWNAWATNSPKWQEETEAAVWASFGQRNDAPETLRSLVKEFGQPAGKPEPTESDKAFKFYAGDDYAVDFNAAPEIIEDVLPDRGIVMVFGPSGKGKTFWTLDLAFHVHNGAKWRDKDVVQGDVMYVAAEAGRGIKKRIQAVKRLNPEWRAPFIADIAPDLASLTSLEAVRDAAIAVGKPSIVIIDTMSAAFEGDDSSQQDIAKMMRNLKMLSDALECLVVFVHHTTKDGGSYRGSGVLFANVDAVLELVSEGEGSDRKQWVTQRKHREGEDGKSYPFKLTVSEPLASKPNGKPITSCTVEQEEYTPVQSVKKTTSGSFETSENFGAARLYLSILQDEVGLGNAMIEETALISAIQKDEKDNKSGFEDHPRPDNIKRTLLTLAKLGKIRKEGRWIRLC